MPNDNRNLGNARQAKNDEFYTQFVDIQKEINHYLEYNPNIFKNKTVLLPCDDPEWSNFTKFFAQNFERFGLKKLISTSYARAAKRIKYRMEEFHQMSLFESESPIFNSEKSETHGRIFTLYRDINQSGKIDIEDLEWEYLEGDGDFRSEEVARLRDEADIIVTNPPYSLFTEFIQWIISANKSFLVIGNQNAATYKEIFELLKANKVWWGAGDCVRWFVVPDSTNMKTKINANGERIAEGARSRWFTNIDHGRRHVPLSLMTMQDNIRYSKHKKIKGVGYFKYDNYDALEVPFTDAIPSDYDGVMGVPVTFLDKYNPDQFEIIWTTDRGGDGMLEDLKLPHTRYDAPVVNGQGQYKRILIKKR